MRTPTGLQRGTVARVPRRSRACPSLTWTLSHARFGGGCCLRRRELLRPGETLGRDRRGVLSHGGCHLSDLFVDDAPVPDDDGVPVLACEVLPGCTACPLLVVGVSPRVRRGRSRVACQGRNSKLRERDGRAIDCPDDDHGGQDQPDQDDLAHEARLLPVSTHREVHRRNLLTRTPLRSSISFIRKIRVAPTYTSSPAPTPATTWSTAAGEVVAPVVWAIPTATLHAARPLAMAAGRTRASIERIRVPSIPSRRRRRIQRPRR